MLTRNRRSKIPVNFIVKVRDEELRTNTTAKFRDLQGIKSTLLFLKGYKALLDYVLLPEDCQDLHDFFPAPVASALYALERFYVKKGN